MNKETELCQFEEKWNGKFRAESQSIENYISLRHFNYPEVRHYSIALARRPCYIQARLTLQRSRETVRVRMMQNKRKNISQLHCGPACNQMCSVPCAYKHTCHMVTYMLITHSIHLKFWWQILVKEGYIYALVYATEPCTEHHKNTWIKMQCFSPGVSHTETMSFSKARELSFLEEPGPRSPRKFVFSCRMPLNLARGQFISVCLH